MFPSASENAERGYTLNDNLCIFLPEAKAGGGARPSGHHLRLPAHGRGCGEVHRCSVRTDITLLVLLQSNVTVFEFACDRLNYLCIASVVFYCHLQYAIIVLNEVSV